MPDTAIGGDHVFAFIGGLHRSGTSLTHSILRSHPEVSGFHDTGVTEDEGQHLQTVYPPASAFGGPGRFGFSPDAHMTEHSPLVSSGSAERLFAQWSSYWDLSCRILTEKSPPNLIRTRFLQALFPDARFILVVRHPVTVALASKKWRRRQSLESLVAHWFRCHEIMRADLPHLDHAVVLRYEALVRNPVPALERLTSLLDLSSPLDPGPIRRADDRYLEDWERRRRRTPSRQITDRIVRRFSAQAESWGYDIDDLTSGADGP